MGKNEITEDMTADNSVGIHDELGEDIQEQYKEELQKEVESFEDAIKSTQEALENFQEQWENDKVVYNEMMKDGKESIKKINPEYSYELSDKYWEGRFNQLWYKWRQDSFLAERKIEEYKLKIEEMQKQLESSKQKLEEMEKGE